MSDIIGKKRKFLNYSEEELKIPPSPNEAPLGVDDVSDSLTLFINNHNYIGVLCRILFIYMTNWTSFGCGIIELALIVYV